MVSIVALPSQPSERVQAALLSSVSKARVLLEASDLQVVASIVAQAPAPLWNQPVPPAEGTAAVPFQPTMEKEGNATKPVQTPSASSRRTRNTPWRKLRVADYNAGRRFGNGGGQAGAFRSYELRRRFRFKPDWRQLRCCCCATNNNNPFGSNTTNTGFSSNTSRPPSVSNTGGGGLFGSKPASGGLFGNSSTQPATTTTGGLFGSSNNDNTATTNNPFGGASSSGFGNSTGGGLFGNTQNQSKPSLFGNAGTSNNSTGFSFGNSTSNSTGGGGLFNNKQPATSSNSKLLEACLGMRTTTNNSQKSLFGGSSGFGASTQGPTTSANQAACSAPRITTLLGGPCSATTITTNSTATIWRWAFWWQCVSDCWWRALWQPEQQC